MVGALALIGGLILGKPLLSRDKARAKESQKTTEQLIASLDKQGASAAASVATIGAANNEAPDSPAKAFISREVPVALSQLPAPDPKALLEAEKRKVAVMEGRLEEADKLYGDVAKRAEKLQKERDEAIAEKRAADNALLEAAAAKAAAEQQRLIFLALAGSAIVVLIYVKVTHTSLPKMGEIMAAIRSGENPIQAIDRLTMPFLHAKINKYAKLATPTKDA